MRSCLLLLLVGVLVRGEKRSYEGYQLYSVFPSAQQVDFVAEMSGDVELDFWYEARDRFDILVPPHKLNNFRADLQSKQISYQVVDENIQRLIDQEEVEMANKKFADGYNFDYDNFNTLADIFTELDRLVTVCPPGSTCDIVNIGFSHEGRDIRGIRITRGTGRRALWMDATIHAREWLATATIMKIIRNVIENHADSEVSFLLDNYDLYLLPVVNPDGYSYTHTNERLWRKNRRQNTDVGSTCFGTDLNRNYDQMWGNAGASTNPCSDTYRGPSAGSEPETVVTQGALRNVAPSLLFSVHLHTYGYLWLIPWGSVTSTGACNFAADHAEMMVFANAGANAVQSTWNTNTWARGNSCATIYPASGITMDYSKGVGGVRFTITPELRGNNFVIAASQIEPSFREIWNGWVATERAMRTLE